MVCAALLVAAGVAVAAPVVKGPYLTEPRPNGITVRFETAAPVAARVVVATGDEVEREEASPPGTDHAVRFDDLRPGTRYRYRVWVGSEAGTEASFKTAPLPDRPFSFVVMGDTRSAEAEHRAVIDRLAGEAPDLLIHTGDLVADGAEEDGWQSFFSVQAPLIARVPIAPSLGNHEAQNELGLQNFTRYFGIAPHDGEFRYAFDYGNSRFIFLDTNVMFLALGAQTGWLEDQLQSAAGNPDIRHIFVIMHHGPFSTGPHGGNLAVRAAWAPMFAAYGVDAVFSGHDHLYERLEHDRVRYVVSGGGGGPLYPRDPQAGWDDVRASLYTESVHHFVRVQVAGDRVEMSAVRADGSLIESVQWRIAQRRVPPPRIARTVPEPRVEGGASPWLAALVAGLCGVAALAVLGWRRRTALAGRGH